MKQNENDRSCKKESSLVVDKKPNGKSQMNTRLACLISRLKVMVSFKESCTLIFSSRLFLLRFSVILAGMLASGSICAQSTVSFTSGVFTNDTILSLAGPPGQEVYGVSFGDSSAQTTSNGYAFQANESSNVSYSATGTFTGFLSGGGTTGDTAFNTILADGRVGGGAGILVLSNLSVGVKYQVMLLLADTRSSENGRQFSVTSGTITSPSQQYAFAGGTPSVGGYVMGTFIATGVTQTFINNNAFGFQLNAILVCSRSTVSFTSGVFTNDTVLSLAGSPTQEVYGVSFGDSSAQITSNGYAFQADGNSNVAYNVTGTYTGFLSGGGTTGDAAFNTILADGRVGGGTGTLILSNLIAGFEYQVMFLLADTRSSEGGRQFSVTSGTITSPSQEYAFVGGTPSVGGYVSSTFVADGATQTFTNNNAFGFQLNAILVCQIGEVQTNGPPVPELIVPTLNTNEAVVAMATPQQYGAVGDGITDDSGAFQEVINAVYNSGTFGGGVVYVPAGNYAFYTNIVVPTGVTLHGDWTDWTKSGGPLVGTTFKVYFGAGQTNAAAFITLEASAALRDVNIWYPNQNPDSITGYPFSITVNGCSVVQNVVLVNSYQGIECGTLATDGGSGGSSSILSTVIGTPLYTGYVENDCFDITYAQDIRFSPAIWPGSGLTNAPAAGGSYATWMRANGTGIQLLRIDGESCVGVELSGYNKGIDFEATTNGTATAGIYEGYVTNCAIAVNAQIASISPAVEFSDFTVEGDTAINRTVTTNDLNFQFSHCTITGDNGTAVNFVGNTWQSGMAFQSCAITGTMNLTGPGVLSTVDCEVNASTQCIMSASATRAAFVGCTFSPSQNIVNNGNVSNLLVDARQSITNAMPIVYWTNTMNNYASRQPARQLLFNVLDYGATINSTNDSTVAIQAALNAAGMNGGGIVYLPAGQYNTTNTLTVPGGVELRGAYEMRHSSAESSDRQEKGSILQPTGGQGTTNGPVAIALEANSGLVGLTIFYPTQTSNCIPFPATIQGQGPNVYAIGVQCPNPYEYVDFDTYTCTNHLLDMVDGWALETGCQIGNGSSGSIVNCHENFSFWVEYWPDAGKGLSGTEAPAVESFGKHNLQYYLLGDCSESFVASFSIQANIFMHGFSENDTGPNVTSINTMCDSTYQPFVFSGPGPSTVNIVNPNWLVVVSGYSDLTNATALTTTANYQGTIRVFNSPLCGGIPINDYVIGGGDVGFELVHLYQYANSGIQVNGGVFHLINCGGINVVHGASGTFNLTLGAGAGIAGKTNEFIGDYAFNGYTFTNLNADNPANVWVDYAINNYASLDIQSAISVTPTNVITPLSVQSAPGSPALVLQWSDNGSGPASQPSLYQASSLAQPIAWTLVTNAPALSNGQWTVKLSKSTNVAGFYELRPNPLD